MTQAFHKYAIWLKSGAINYYIDDTLEWSLTAANCSCKMPTDLGSTPLTVVIDNGLSGNGSTSGFPGSGNVATFRYVRAWAAP